jgi:Subtilisin inhibitor-like
MKPAPPVITIRFPWSGIGGEFSSTTIVPRVLALLLITLVLGVGGSFMLDLSGESGSAAVSARSADLRIVVWPMGKQKAARPVRWTLRCGPVGGTLPRRKRACARLLALRRPFRGVPRGAACTEIYGGPQLAEVRGSLKSRRVMARFARTDGCQIERWNRVRFLFPVS